MPRSWTHVKRAIWAGALAGVVLWATAGAAAFSPSATAAAADQGSRRGVRITLNPAERTVLKLVNRARTSRGLHAVRLSAALCRAAAGHSTQMVRKDYFSHYSFGGADFASRILAYGYSRVGCTGWRVGEVIGWGKGARGSARSVVRRWMADSIHRRVILDPGWRDIGIGRAIGTFSGVSDVRMFTVDFGRRLR